MLLTITIGISKLTTTVGKSKKKYHIINVAEKRFQLPLFTVVIWMMDEWMSIWHVKDEFSLLRYHIFKIIVILLKKYGRISTQDIKKRMTKKRL